MPTTPTTLSELHSDDVSIPWIELKGHLADALLLSSVLKSIYDASGQRFGIVRRPPLSGLFVGHPAVACISARAPVTPRVWWQAPGETSQLPSDWQRAAHLLTHEAVPDAAFWAPSGAGQGILESLPLPGPPILIAPVPLTPRGNWARDRWCQLVEELRILTDIPLAVIAHPRVQGLPGCINVSGLLAPQEMLGLAGVSVGVVGVDPFVLRGAHMQQVPSLALLGPDWTRTDPVIRHLSSSGIRTCEVSCHHLPSGPALGPCPEAIPCMTELSVEQVMGVVRSKWLPMLENRPSAHGTKC